MTKFIIHYSLHFLAPLLIAYWFFNKKWKIVYIVFLFSMLVDVDHFFANPVFVENRCSINFHPLHSYFACGVYFLGIFFKKTRILAFALLFHMVTDFIDCYL